jgi:hypothetical protein
MNRDQEAYEAAIERVRSLGRRLSRHDDAALREMGAAALRRLGAYLAPAALTGVPRIRASETELLTALAEVLELEAERSPPTREL